MINSIVRLLAISIKNFKNVEYGTIKFNIYENAKKEFKLKKGDLLGVYGQNGSGKTTLIEAIDILRILLSGGGLPENIRDLIACDEEECTFKATFYIEFKEHKYLIYYEVSIRKIANSIMVSNEKLSCSVLEKGKWKAKSRLIDYSSDEKQFLKPAYRWSEIRTKNKEGFLMLNVAKELSKKRSTSFIFSEETKSTLHVSLEENHETINIVDYLEHFARFNLYVITNKQSGFINSNQLLRLEQKDKSVTEDFTINIFEPFMIPARLSEAFTHSIEQMSMVLETILPELNLELFEHNRQYLNVGEVGIQVEILSAHEGKRIPLRNESAGVKKLVWILGTVIAMYNQPQVCLAIDDMDLSVFEYLFGELLEVLRNGANGQLIFTAHSLRALEKLNKESIVTTTANPNNRYIRLEYVKSNDNLRDFYLRALALGGQKEILYKETNTFEMQHALRAGAGNNGV